MTKTEYKYYTALQELGRIGELIVKIAADALPLLTEDKELLQELTAPSIKTVHKEIGDS